MIYLINKEMSFKLKGSSYVLDNTPIYQVDMENNVLGRANKNGSILINKNISPLEISKNKTKRTSDEIQPYSPEEVH